MVVNEDHYLNRIFHEPGDHALTLEEFDTRYVLAGARVLVDPADPADVAAVNALQDQFGLQRRVRRAIRRSRLRHARVSTRRARRCWLWQKASRASTAPLAREAEVDAVRHLLGTAAGWGGLPEREASYVNVDPGLPLGRISADRRDVPVDGFWSISMYNAAGYFEPNDRHAYSVNNLTATPNDDGSMTVHFGGCADDRPNCLPITEGWNYLVRLYRPRPEILDGSWQFPKPSQSADVASAALLPAQRRRHFLVFGCRQVILVPQTVSRAPESAVLTH